MNKIKNIKIYFFTIITMLLPSLSFAVSEKSFSQLVNQLVTKDLYKTLIGLIYSGAFIFFFWGVTSVIFAEGDSGKMAEGKKKMLWGIIALFIMFSFNGIVNVLISSFDDLGGAQANHMIVNFRH